MKEKLKLLTQKIDAMTMRERLLILVALIVAIHQAWDSLVWRPMVQQQDVLYAQEEQITRDIQSIQVTLNGLANQAKIDPNKAIKEQIANLDSQIGAVETYIQNETSSLMKPPEMAKLLKSILDNQQGLRLINLEKKEAVALLQPEIDEATKKPIPVEYQIYRHGFSVQFRGNYLATLSYLKALEEQDDKFFWDSIEYDANEYPAGVVTINLYTLSLSEGWIGV